MKMHLKDQWISAIDNALRTVSGVAQAGRAAPRADDAQPLDPAQKRLSGSLMRVNHVGEVCAQALYEAQALTARTAEVREQMAQASREEIDHLAWTAQRLDELGDRRSLLNPIWYSGAFAIGLVAGRAGDRWSLGFLAETERQVAQHLADHLDRLPAEDTPSRAIVSQMKLDETHHAEMAEEAGGHALPAPLRWLMRSASKVMTTTAHYV